MVFPAQSYLNFIRSPDAPFVVDATLHVTNYANFTNNGAGVTWTPFDMPGTGYQTAVALIDPTTGLPRLIFGNDTGIWSVLDDNGSFETTIGGFDSTPGINRNGNLQITQFYYGAAQPSTAAAEAAGALFYGGAQNTGGPSSSPNILTTGDLQWSIPGQLQSGAGVATDQQGPARSTSICSPSRAVTTPTPISSRSTAPAGPSACSRPAAASPLPTRNGSPSASPTSPSTRSTATMP